MPHAERITQTLTGSGLVLERTEKPGGATPWWWITDAVRGPKAASQTYRHRELLKAHGCRWSKKRRAWYFIGAELPDEIAALAGPQDPTGDPVAQNDTPVADVTATPRYSRRLRGSAPTAGESYQERVLRRFAEQFQADLHRISRCPALPPVATIRLEDPWA